MNISGSLNGAGRYRDPSSERKATKEGKDQYHEKRRVSSGPFSDALVGTPLSRASSADFGISDRVDLEKAKGPMLVFFASLCAVFSLAFLVLAIQPLLYPFISFSTWMNGGWWSFAKTAWIYSLFPLIGSLFFGGLAYLTKNSSGR